MKGKVIIMDKNNNERYLENIKHKIEKLDIKGEEYELQLVQQIKILEHNNETIQKFKFTHDMLYDKYISLISLLEKQGIIFEINFNDYKPHEWENLLVVKTGSGYEIRTKAGHRLKMLDENYSKIIGDINKKEEHSLIVIRVTDKTSLVQLRFN
ncbi:hypothetical protein LGK95_05705 [Clostridium algoriphilum]|uniref:hypothetical protein n=1 Tax=Clostridium algoriphilum TaxID=198347 RepID=UPI001CF2970C|nr:hypothetical protein [Clostridium algoriphilum]MCB2293017.1 hypothetical protein [Clostridium algoriphilum]